LGGEALLAQMLPGRGEFGSLITNLEHELADAGVDVRLGTAVDRRLVETIAPDALIIATGARPYLPEIEGRESAHVVDAWAVLKDEANVGSRVVVADWRCDWIGMGLAEKLALAGRHVRLAVNGVHAGQNLQMYLRDHWAAKLHRLGVEVIPYTRLYGVDETTAYFMYSVSGEAITCDNVDTTILALGHAPETALEAEIAGLGVRVEMAGDCRSPRSAEEAIYEGMLAGRAV
jgi:pyruvate/2-oxoglutarate dehydrogenase complex dihydrolipoamide dehydrogenase (E3) component